jgi:hypothetical protein
MRIAIIVALQLLCLDAAFAETKMRTVKLSNVSGDALTQVTAKAEGSSEPATENLLTDSVATGDQGEIALQATDGDCLFTLSFTFASGKTVERPDIDVCQTESIAVE